MQLALSADVLAPVGVGVLVAVLAVIALVIGLRRRADDLPSPTHADWTGEQVADATSSAPRPNRPTRTVADAVAARQIGTDPFAAASPRAGAAEPVRNADPVLDSAEAGGAGTAANGTGPVLVGNKARLRMAIVPEVRAMAPWRSGWARWAALAGDRPAAVAVADPDPVGSAPTTVGVASTVVTDQARHSRPADDGAGGGTEPDPQPGAGSAGEVGSGGRSWFAGAAPQTRPDGPSLPDASGHQAAWPPIHVALPGHGAGASPPSDEAVSSVRPSDDEAAGGRSAERPSPGASGQAVPTRPIPDNSAASTPHPLEPGPQQTSPESDELDAWVATLPGRGPAGERLPTDEAESLPGARSRSDDRLGASPLGARRPPDDGLDAGVVDSAAGARRPDDSADSASDECRSGPSVDHRFPSDGSEPASAAGSSQSVSAAVAQVLAARAAAHVPDADRRGEARDRLLAVLLDDPLRAVGATVDLQDCQERIDRLAATLNDERARLGDVLGRLAGAGLRPDQLARLSGLSDAEVADLLRRGLGT